MSGSSRTAWGPLIEKGGKVGFRLWAPAQSTVTLVVPERGLSLRMRTAADGWFEVETEDVAAGDSYGFRLMDGTVVPDPAARAQADTVHGLSRLVDTSAFDWRAGAWCGRRWEEAIIYELHTGTFTPEGTFDGIRSKLDHLAALGVTAVEIMPIAQFGGRRGWGYDGVLHYAPHVAYGGPEGLQRLVDAAHQRGLMVLLDVVYNHFGPDGNYIHLYAPDFFDPHRHTPWGAVIAYEKRPVRDFFIENAIFWLEQYRIDGLRLDAINQIEDRSDVSLLEEMARRIRLAITDRPVHLTTEDDRNIVALHERDGHGAPRLFTAEWNDDLHHAAHVLATGEREGYYEDYQYPVRKLARALAEGFVYQGEPSPFWNGAARGVPSIGQPPSAFIDFLQNHDQIGNRALGERLDTLAPAGLVANLEAMLLLSPHIPLLFMGQELGERRPFYFFTDFSGELGRLVREGRRDEFKKWSAFEDPHKRDEIPDSNDPATYAACVLDWGDRPEAAHRTAHIRNLLQIRKREIIPRVDSIAPGTAMYALHSEKAFDVVWPVHDGALVMRINFGEAPVKVGAHQHAPQRTLYETAQGVSDRAARGTLDAEALTLILREDVGR